MSNNNYHELGKAPIFHVALSTGFGIGFVPVAPGTAGAAVALLIWYIGYLFLSVKLLFIITILAIVLTTFIGVWTSNVMERYWGTDPRAVVIDEFVGTWIPLLVAPCGHNSWILAFIGFSLFRIIDIFKPLGCKKMEKLPGGYGVMFDDVLAGFYSLIIVLLIRLLFF